MFYDSIDTVFLGSRTFEQVLKVAEWPFAGEQAWVCARP